MVSGVKPFSDEDDRDLERRITSFLADRHVPALRQLHVAASQGTVTLRGRVRSFYEKQLCQNVCRQVKGVVQFVDAVVVA
ncbi:MAG TPA: BON domain-containing protein [Pirellulales bacterium]|jgi:osmotically-inducible protein OsmY